MKKNYTGKDFLNTPQCQNTETLSRKLRKDIKLQINEEKIYENVTLFLGEEFVRITETEGEKSHKHLL